jgi:3'(2'), 5'-bisphosphate nucleotidase
VSLQAVAPKESTSPRRHELRHAVEVAVTAAGRAIMNIYAAGGTAVQTKDDQSPLTAADLASHASLVDSLSALDPHLPVVSEEGGLPPAEQRAAWPAYWLIDPLDGTKEFLARNGEFTVNVALIEGGRPTVGVVGVPATGHLFSADVEQRVAERVSPTGERTRLTARRYAGPRPVVVASRRHGGEQLTAALERIEEVENGIELRNVGSSLKFCLLAEGLADVYPRLAPTCEWDTAAAQAVLEAAGGAVLQLSAEPLAYSKADILNPSFVAVADASAGWLRWFSQQRD